MSDSRDRSRTVVVPQKHPELGSNRIPNVWDAPYPRMVDKSVKIRHYPSPQEDSQLSILICFSSKAVWQHVQTIHKDDLYRILGRAGPFWIKHKFAEDANRKGDTRRPPYTNTMGTVDFGGFSGFRPSFGVDISRYNFFHQNLSDTTSKRYIKMIFREYRGVAGRSESKIKLQKTVINCKIVVFP